MLQGSRRTLGFVEVCLPSPAERLPYALHRRIYIVENIGFFPICVVITSERAVRLGI
jgi:hypothetical protein